MYLKGDGGIPMRQEFFIVGNVPKEESRPYVSSKSPKKTFSSSITLEGIFPEGTKVQATGQNDSAKTIDKNKFEWELRNLASGETTQRYLQVSSGENKYFARYDILRGSPYFFRGGLQYDTPSGVPYAQVNFQWWLEGFLSPFNSAVDFDLNFHLGKKDGYPEYDEYRISYIYKFSSGFYMEKETWGAGLLYSMIKGKDFSMASPGVKFWGLRKSLDFFPDWIEWYYPYMTYLMGNSSGDIKMKSGLELGAIFYTPLKETTYLTYGFRYLSYTFDPAFADEKGQIGLNIGYSMKF
jgi:hypothetical protein